MATNSSSFREESIKYHEKKAMEITVQKIRSHLYPKIENLDYEKVREFWKYLKEC